jgi:manganese oxidase
LNAYDIEPGSATPQVNTMLDFNLFAFNSRVFPGIDSLNVRLNDRVRIRVGNLTMTNHPIHLHGVEFEVTGTDGGPVPKAARWPEVTTDVAVGRCGRSSSRRRGRRLGAALPQEPPHDERDGPRRADHDRRRSHGLAGKISKLIPDYMVMGERGMADMAEMEMPLPDNTLPMMSGQGPYGAIEMGGMFTVMKVRREQPRGDYSDPDWFRHPPGTVAREVEGTVAEPVRAPRAASPQGTPNDVEVSVRKPTGHAGH